MRIKHESDVSMIEEIDYLSSETSSSASTAHLIARIARRPGRWRKRMGSRKPHNTEEYFQDEAA